MPRRTFSRTQKGQPYAVEWPEWFVDCAVNGCDESLLLTGLGEAMTLGEVEKQGREAVTRDGWQKYKGLYFCPKHLPKENRPCRND